MTKKRIAQDYLDQLKLLAQTGMEGSPSPSRTADDQEMPSLSARIEKVLGLISSDKRPVANMLFFVMYDIESDKTRRYVVKYLERMGCVRVQKSIFLADLPSEKYSEIKKSLTAVQAVYENEDSILVVPISTELLNSMKIIGQSIDIDFIVKNKNTLFF